MSLFFDDYSQAKKGIVLDYGRIPLAEECRVLPWYKKDGDKNLRIDYKLGPSSVVYDVGGYHGDWAEDIHKKYGSTVEVFEPVERFVKLLEKKFTGNKKIHIYPFGLSDKNEVATISLEEASSSLFKTKDASEKIKLVAAHTVIKPNEKIDLMKMNIEAGEYALLEDLLKHDLVKNITNIQIQFHVFIDNADARRKKLHSELSKTHELTYCYPYIWENWRRK
jgi:FkbM family methyltransferase